MSHFAVAVLNDGRRCLEGLLAPYMENCCAQPDYKYMEFYEDEDCDVDEATGKRGYWQNPNAKWDWYDETGGRFKGYAENLVGFQHGKVSDIEFDREAHREAAEKWWDENIDEDGNPKGMAIFEYDGPDRERYIESRSHLSFRAVVTPDGVWHEVGEMGWWGISSEDADESYEWRMHFEERFIEPYQDCTLTVVDCHI